MCKLHSLVWWIILLNIFHQWLIQQIPLPVAKYKIWVNGSASISTVLHYFMPQYLLLHTLYDSFIIIWKRNISHINVGHRSIWSCTMSLHQFLKHHLIQKKVIKFSPWKGWLSFKFISGLCKNSLQILRSHRISDCKMFYIIFLLWITS